LTGSLASAVGFLISDVIWPNLNKSVNTPCVNDRLASVQIRPLKMSQHFLITDVLYFSGLAVKGLLRQSLMCTLNDFLSSCQFRRRLKEYVVQLSVPSVKQHFQRLARRSSYRATDVAVLV